jgi:hypothetical protein
MLGGRKLHPVNFHRRAVPLAQTPVTQRALCRSWLQEKPKFGLPSRANTVTQLTDMSGIVHWVSLTPQFSSSPLPYEALLAAL